MYKIDEKELVLTALKSSEYHSPGLYRYDTDLWLKVGDNEVIVTTWTDRFDDDAGRTVEVPNDEIRDATKDIPMPTIIDKLFAVVKEKTGDTHG